MQTQSPHAGFRLARTPSGTVSLTFDDGSSFPEIQIIRAAPLTHPDRYICFLDVLGREICMVESLSELEREDRLMVEEELQKRYIISVIKRLISVRREAGTSYWEVDTNRGMRELVIEISDQNVRGVGEYRVLMVDIDGNRFEVPDITALDRTSRRVLRENLDF